VKTVDSKKKLLNVKEKSNVLGENQERERAKKKKPSLPGFVGRGKGDGKSAEKI